jgi:hypothetical protein
MRWLQQARKKEERLTDRRNGGSHCCCISWEMGGGGLIQAQRLQGNFFSFFLLDAFFCFRFPSVVQYAAKLQCILQKDSDINFNGKHNESESGLSIVIFSTSAPQPTSIFCLQFAQFFRHSHHKDKITK